MAVLCRIATGIAEVAHGHGFFAGRFGQHTVGRAAGAAGDAGGTESGALLAAGLAFRTVRGGVLAGGLCVGTHRAGGGRGRQCVEANRMRIVGQRIGTAAKRGGAIADGVGRVARRQRVVPLPQRTGHIVAVAAGLEEAAGGAGGARHRIQLRLVHCIGGLRASSHVGDLAFVAGAADRHRAGTVGH
ncbi:hypothetical protein G6F59_014595 [Rhizopus arrhizus]|nr:hypothetical protein G6F59_014595 [Rhizopus arrhizus]